MSQRRAQRNLTLRALADLVEQNGTKIDASGLSRIESGEREPRLGEALAIATALGIGLTGLTDTYAVRLRNEHGNLSWVVGELKTWSGRVVELHNDIESFLRDLPNSDQRSRAANWLHVNDVRTLAAELQALLPSIKELHRALMDNEDWLAAHGNDIRYDEVLSHIIDGPSDAAT